MADNAFAVTKAHGKETEVHATNSACKTLHKTEADLVHRG